MPEVYLTEESPDLVENEKDMEGGESVVQVNFSSQEKWLTIEMPMKVLRSLAGFLLVVLCILMLTFWDKKQIKNFI